MQNTRMHFHFLRLYNLVSGRPAPRKKALSFADLLRAKRRYFCNSSDGGQKGAKPCVKLACKQGFAPFCTSDGHPMLLGRL